MSATGGSLSYQWVRGNTVLSGQRSRNLKIDSVSESDAGIYWVLVSNLAGTVASPSVHVEISADGPQIISHPQSQTVQLGQRVSLNVEAVSSERLSYQWFRNGIRVSGATSSTLTMSSINESQFGSYTCVVSSSSGSATSQFAIISDNSRSTFTSNVRISGIDFVVNYSTSQDLRSASNLG